MAAAELNWYKWISQIMYVLWQEGDCLMVSNGDKYTEKVMFKPWPVLLGWNGEMESNTI